MISHILFKWLASKRFCKVFVNLWRQLYIQSAQSSENCCLSLWKAPKLVLQHLWPWPRAAWPFLSCPKICLCVWADNRGRDLHLTESLILNHFDNSPPVMKKKSLCLSGSHLEVFLHSHSETLQLRCIDGSLELILPQIYTHTPVMGDMQSIYLEATYPSSLLHRLRVDNTCEFVCELHEDMSQGSGGCFGSLWKTNS